jgi:hypothetical protein
MQAGTGLVAGCKLSYHLCPSALKLPSCTVPAVEGGHECGGAPAPAGGRVPAEDKGAPVSHLHRQPSAPWLGVLTQAMDARPKQELQEEVEIQHRDKKRALAKLVKVGPFPSTNAGQQWCLAALFYHPVRSLPHSRHCTCSRLQSTRTQPAFSAQGGCLGRQCEA